MLPKKLEQYLALSRSEAYDRLQEGRAGVQHTFAGFGMDSDEWMLTNQRTVFEGLLQRCRPLTICGNAIAVHTSESVDEFAEGRGEGLVRGGKADPLGITSVGRHDVAAQNRLARWIDRSGYIGVPPGPRAHHWRRQAAVGDPVFGD